MIQQIHGGDVYRHRGVTDFSSNRNPLGTPPGVLRAAEESIRLISQYPDIFCTELRTALAAKEGVSGEEILFGNGAAELLFALVQEARPRKALLAVPAFLEYEQALRSAGCEIHHYVLKAENGFRLREDFLQELVPGLDMVFLCNPNNPTGLTIPRELLDRILARCEACGILLVLDECFLDFLDEPEAYSMRERMKRSKSLFLLRAFTKIYAMAGLRLGYALCSDRVRLSRIRDCLQPWNVSLPAQAAGTAALREDGYLAESRRVIREERQYLLRELKKLPLTVYDSEAGYVFFSGREDLGELALAAGFLIRDCSNYPGLTKGYYRIAVRAHEDNERLIQWLNQL